MSELGIRGVLVGSRLSRPGLTPRARGRLIWSNAASRPSVPTSCGCRISRIWRHGREQTALNVLTQSFATEWIDLPTLAATSLSRPRAPIDPEALRTGAVPGDGGAPQIVRALTNAERKVSVAPSGRSVAQRDVAQAQQRISDAEARSSEPKPPLTVLRWRSRRPIVTGST